MGGGGGAIQHTKRKSVQYAEKKHGLDGGQNRDSLTEEKRSERVVWRNDLSFISFGPNANNRFCPAFSSSSKREDY